MRNTSGIKVNDKSLTDIIAAHAEWFEDNKTGSGANLGGANLSGAYLSGADLIGADLSGANGIMSFGPLGKEGRIGQAVIADEGTMFALGCHWGNLTYTCAKIVKKYGENSLYEKQVRLADEILQAKKVQP
jgi:hypothetical protein